MSHSISDIQHKRVTCLDGWRGMCILIVLAAHFAPVPFVEWGDLGVDLFFVLSGRLMADILFLQKSSLISFYIRRFSRVWPALLVYTLFCFVVFQNSDVFLHVTQLAAAAALTFTTNYKVMFWGQTQLLDHTWSLCVEEHSYIALGLIASLARHLPVEKIKMILITLAAVMAVNGAILTVVRHVDTYDVYWRSDVRGASVFFAAFIYLHFSAGRARIAGGLAGYRNISVYALLLAIPLYASHLPPVVHFTVGTALIALAVCRLEQLDARFLRFFESRVLVAFGTYSFSIYIWQQLLYKLFQNMRDIGALSRMEGVEARPALVIAACVLGIVSYHVVEKPARRFINESWAALYRARPVLSQKGA